MKRFRKPLSVLLAVVMLFGIFAGALTTFAAVTIRENTPVNITEDAEELNFTPGSTGFYVFKFESEICDPSDVSVDVGTATNWLEVFHTVYSYSGHEYYQYYQLEAGVTYTISFPTFWEDDYSADLTVSYVATQNLSLGREYAVSDVAIFAYTPTMDMSALVNVTGRYVFDDYAESSYAEADIRYYTQDDGYSSLACKSSGSSFDEEWNEQDETYTRSYKNKLLFEGMTARTPYYIFIERFDSITDVSFSLSRAMGTPVERVNISSDSFIPNWDSDSYLSYGTPFPEDFLSILSINKMFKEEEEEYIEDGGEPSQGPAVPNDAARISNVAFINAQEEAEDGSVYWRDANPTNDPYMMGDYILRFDITLDNGYFFFDPGVYADEAYNGMTVLDIDEHTIRCGKFVSAEKYHQDGLIYSVDPETKTASVYDYEDYKTTTYNIPRILSIANEEYTVDKIGVRALSGSNVSSVKIPETVTEIAYESFRGTKLTSVEIPASANTVSNAAFRGAQSLKEIKVKSGNPNYTAVNKVLYSKDKKTLHTYPAGITATSFTVPSTVNTIGEDAFSGTAKLKTLSMPSSVSRIGERAFKSSSIQTTAIPTAVRTIPAYAFANSYISSINLNSVTKIDESAFEGTDRLKEVFIPKTVTEIGAYAFGYSALKKIVFAKGSKISTIGNFAFGYDEYWDWDDDLGETLTVNPIKNFTACYFESGVKTVLENYRKALGATKAIKYIAIPSNNIAKCSVTIGKSATYKGKAITPGIVVKSGKYVLKNGVDYTVTYSKNKLVGRAVVTIVGKGSFTGKKVVGFNILPKGTSIKSLKGAKKSFTVKLSKQATQTNGYQIQYSLKKNFSKAKTVKVGKNTTTKRISRLEGGKRYYVRVRTYRTIGKTTFCSGWSSTKSVVTKK